MSTVSGDSSATRGTCPTREPKVLDERLEGDVAVRGIDPAAPEPAVSLCRTHVHVRQGQPGPLSDHRLDIRLLLIRLTGPGMHWVCGTSRVASAGMVRVARSRGSSDAVRDRLLGCGARRVLRREMGG